MTKSSCMWCGIMGLLVVWAMVLAGTLGATAASSQTSMTEVMLNIAEAIEVVSWPEASLTLSSVATPGEPVVSGALRFTVKCNSTWGIQVQSDESTGKLREFNVGTASYVTEGKISQKAVEWGLTTSGPWTGVSSSLTSIVTNKPATGDVGTAVTFYLRYVPGFNDVPLTGDGIYRIVLTYTAAVGY